MTLFEYLAIAFSLVFSFSATRLVSGLAQAFDPTRRYSVHLVYVLSLLVTTALVFWNFWSFRGVEWNLLRFLLALASPGLLYFLACTLVPDNPAGVASWRDYFYRVRRRLFFGIGAWTLVVIVNSLISLELPLNHPVRLLWLFQIALTIVGVSSDRPAVHTTLAIAVLVLLLSFGAVAFLPGALSA